MAPPPPCGPPPEVVPPWPWCKFNMNKFESDYADESKSTAHTKCSIVVLTEDSTLQSKASCTFHGYKLQKVTIRHDSCPDEEQKEESARIKGWVRAD